jgi:hypothetical protein
MTNEKLSSSQVLGALTGSPEGKPARFRVSRGCYDKYKRCPGWAGGGRRYATVRRCNDGFLPYYTADGIHVRRLWRWRVNRCPECRLWVLPYASKWADPSWLRWAVTWRLEDWRQRHGR